MDVLIPAVQACGPSIAALGLGWFLRQSICNETDGETAAKFALWITLPSLILQSFNKVPLGEFGLPIAAIYTAGLSISVLIAWIRSQGLHPKERGILAGVSVGSSVGLTAIPFAAALFPGLGLRAALLCTAINLLATYIASYMLFSSAGAAFPESFEHLDGGNYRGEWKGMLKDGYGVYFYPGGARYEGQWREGLKDGRGVYFFPKGGLYEGEWLDGTMSGIGVRTFASGKVKAGLWEAGTLVRPMEDMQCALAVEGANEAAAVAKKVVVGGATWDAALRGVASQPAFWAFVAVVGMAVAGVPLTPTVDVATRNLAAAHGPLALLSIGLTMGMDPLPQRQLKEIAKSLTGRLIPPLLTVLIATVAAHVLQWPAAVTLSGLLGPLAVCVVAPVSGTALKFAHIFRLNEAFAAGMVQAGTMSSFLLMPFLGATAAVSAAVGSYLPFMTAVAAATMSIGMTALLVALKQVNTRNHLKNKVKMVYAPPTPSSAVVDAAAAPVVVQQDAPAGSKAAENAAPPASEQVKPVEESPPPSQVKRSKFKDVGGEEGTGPSPPPPAAAAINNMRLRKRLQTPARSPMFRSVVKPINTMKLTLR